jgi:Tol biopolymer transport system component/DNA-binding winged helix-turn-helix (wHTH) protein
LEDKQLYRFGEFYLSVDDRSLRRGDENIALTPKMYELLLVLVQNPNRIVEKDFLLQAVWPDSFVEEGNITFNIRQLRKALGDNAQRPIYIETIPRRGYRFLPKVDDAAPDNGVVEPPQEIGQAEGIHGFFKWRPTLAISAFVLLIALMGSAVWFSRESAAKGAPILSVPFATEKLSTDGRVSHAVITSDGKTVVYTRLGSKKQSLWLRQLETSNNIEILPPSETFFGGLAVSPDGSTVYMARVSAPLVGQQFDIYRVPIVGGAPQKLVAETQGWISVSADGEKISFVRCYYKEDEFCSLWIADAADGGNERKLVSRPRPFRIGDNKISPDGRKVAFAVGQSWTGSNEFNLMEVDIETGLEQELTPQKFFNINYIAWLPGQSGWLITALKLPDKNYRIWRVPTAGGEPAMLTADAETYSHLSLDAKGGLMVATRIDSDFKLNIYKTEDGGEAPRVLADGASVVFAPDDKIFYSSNMTGDSEIWSMKADGTDQRQLTHEPSNDAAPIVSPDNKAVFFSSNRSGELHVWRMSLDGSDQTQVTTQEGGYPLRLSPDGQWVYYRSGLRNTLRRVLIKDGQEELVSSSPRADLALSPDTSRVALTQRENDEYNINILSLADNRIEKTFKVFDPKIRPAYVIWSHDGRDILYILEDEQRENRSLWLQGLTDAKPRKIADLGTIEIFELSGLALSYDAKSFVIAQGKWNHNSVLIRGLKP